ncbi:helix-turn-helix domain-containing protein [Sphingobacterium siyangense]|uniref:helix-turn-helix domain-containing protein n=1 Tax=Sphingobacterium siyangense TaxID=459529 RepID=UPI001963D520|nr:helix-turn-helix transcriptional regulator [Sphingobacterium siyangense]QRY58489.1 helix-turn-helix transcriptional regulator [Sphingobacterium siyangense]
MSEKDIFLKNIGASIRKLRLDKGLTQLELAHKVGKDQQSIQRLEAGNINATLYYLSEIATGLDMSFEDFMKELKSG